MMSAYSVDGHRTTAAREQRDNSVFAVVSQMNIQTYCVNVHYGQINNALGSDAPGVVLVFALWRSITHEKRGTTLE